MALKINFNFAAKCSLDCEFCYVDFNGSRIDEERCAAIFDRIATLNPSKITIAGGDPFNYRFLTRLIEIAFNACRNVHVDTNAHGLKETHLSLLKEKVKLVGLPLDGSNAAMHGKMRGRADHFDLIVKWISILRDYGITIKINTVISNLNKEDVHKIGKLIETGPIAQWSLFQFWPMEAGKRNEATYSIAEDEVMEVINHIRQLYPALPVRSGTIEERKGGYLFVNHDGNVSTVNPKNHSIYANIGSIFEDDIISKWATLNCA